ncbi:alpha-L-rhamnosidase [Flavihumibacter petaseus]|uniref:alpha-L-rhamnosidase n=1 Tax=Flavihumibacter petaseus NBRC 106054 TaxID=1220578 RepID=A0A0E9MUZ8_9BACT|nr:alpha-L-rhamnosidase [Flavihumibacter petaseus]GAO41384.1 putative alpha-L-rhamnosidase [Flavihumibacter petaseus NBRC 106054]
MGKFFLAILACCMSVISLGQGAPTTTPRVENLQTEHLTEPLGLDAASPRLSWQVSDARPLAKQSAYRVIVATSNDFGAKSLIWNSNKLSSDKQLAVYAGLPLAPFTRYYWKVESWDHKGTALPAAASWFETGMLQQANWKGAWISDDHDVDFKPAPIFRKGVKWDKPVRSARAYIAAAGLYELSVNGQRVGNHRLDPMYTRFDRRTLYVTYDITALLQPGDNAFGVLLGNGWYNHQSTAVWDFHKAPWRGRPAFCMDVRVEFTDGTIGYLSTGKDWKTSLSDIDFNSIYTAEHIDAGKRDVIEGWNTPAFKDTAWKHVTLRAAPSMNIIAQAMVPIERVEKVEPVSFKQINDTVWLYDLGRNIAGITSITATGPKGTVLRLKHAERLDSAGRADQSNIDVHYRPHDNSDPFQTDIYTLSGKDNDSFAPRFNYKGFQYVEVTASQPIKLTQQSLTGWFMHSNVPPLGKLTASNPLIEKIWQATNNSYLSNLYGYPTDCPQREKNGWTGDAHIAVETGLYNFDGITVYEKWLADHRDEQQPNGVLPSIIPTGGWGYEWGNGPDWTSTIAIIPWTVYLFYGDDHLLKDSYEAIKKYVDRITAISPSGLTTWGLGDWIPVKSQSPVELTSTAYYYRDVTILAKAATLLGKKEDAQQYRALAEKIKAAYNAKYFQPAKASYGSGFQTELSVSLVMGLVPDDAVKSVAATLAAAVRNNGYKLDVGLLGTKAILNALSDNGYADVAYRLAASDQYPSWGYWIANGATTLYENWPINAKSDISLNHIMFGEIGAWFFKGLGGIKPTEENPGFKKIKLEPHFVPALDSFSVSHDGPYGTIRSSWIREGRTVLYTVVIPPNTTAEILFDVMVEGSRKQVRGAGTYTFTVVY